MNQSTQNQPHILQQEIIPAAFCVEASGLQPSSQIRQKSVFKEGFTIKNDKELRKRITNLPKDKLEGVQGQLQMEFENEKGYFVGSGTLIILGSGFKNNKYYLLTCAHNVVSIYNGLQTKVNRLQRATYYYSREDINKFYCSLVGESDHVYPEYEQHSDIWNGFDLALIKLQHNALMYDKSAPKSTNTCWGWIELTEAKAGSIIKVIGYPAEYDGQLYEMEGTIKEMRYFENGQAIILYDNINTSAGQSGSPVYLKKANNIWSLIGVHVGYDSSVNCNIATAITKKVHQWIHDMND